MAIAFYFLALSAFCLYINVNTVGYTKGKQKNYSWYGWQFFLSMSFTYFLLYTLWTHV